MKILFFAYPWAMQSPGGGEVMLLKTKEALEKKGVEARLFNQWEDKFKDFDILHVFGSVKDCLGTMEAARRSGIKVAISPVFWSTLQRSLYEYGSPISKSKMALRHASKVVFPFLPSARRKMLLAADIILPNSESEARQVARLFAVSREKMHIVPLGVDESFSSADSALFINKYGIKDFILSVGRIEPRKNQLNLIKALRGSGKKLVFIGDPVQGYEDYYRHCRSLADKNIIFIGRIEHNDPMLASAYAACSVFVLQGWFETPGLAALEAGLSGARLAVTQQGSTRDYFKGHVTYFDPASPAGIAKAIDNSLAKPKSEVLAGHIKEHFLWAHAAEENIKAYDVCLKK